MNSRANRPVKKKPISQACKRAQLIAEAVTVICPTCGADQPAPGGSLFWTREDFLGLEPARRQCVSCDCWLMVSSDSKVQF